MGVPKRGKIAVEDNINTFKDLRVEDPSSLSAKEKILRTAIILFNRDGIQTTGIDKIISEADVAKMTFYKHFPSKADLIQAYFEFKDRSRLISLMKHTIDKSSDPKEQILGIFDSLEEWFNEADFKGCAFTRGLYEFGKERDSKPAQCVATYFAKLDSFVEERIKKIVAEENVIEIRDRILTIILGSVTMALHYGDPKIARINRELVQEILRGAVTD